MKLKQISAILPATFILLAATASQAVWPFSDNKAKDFSAAEERDQPKIIKKYHLHIPDKQTENELLSAIMKKRQINEEIQVLMRLNKQKQDQFTTIQEGLMQVFQILPDVEYEYDKNKRTIYELVPTEDVVDMNPEMRDGTDEMEADGVRRKVHKRLENEVQMKKLTRLTTAKELTIDAMRTLQSLLREKHSELARVDETLSSKFSMSNNKMYNYDNKNMTLYEVVRPPQQRRAPAMRAR